METKIKNTRVLVTGGAGFIGSNLVDQLLEQGNEVVCLDNFSTGSLSNLEQALKHPLFALLEGDIRNYSDCLRAAKGCRYVLHQAALGSVPRSVADPMTTTDVNVGGFVKMLFAAQEAGVKRFVYAASSAAYGDDPGMPKVEYRTGNALSPYAITKVADEQFARNFSDLYGIETIGLRYFNVFGRRQDPNGAYAAVIPKFARALIRYESPRIYGDGSTSRDFTYIGNVLEANQLAAVTPAAVIRERQKVWYSVNKEAAADYIPGTVAEVFNVACGKRTSLNQLARQLRKNLAAFDPEIGGVVFEYGPPRQGDIAHSLASYEKGRSILGYRPRVGVVRGLEETCAWYWKTRKQVLSI
ncbi:MAG: NAD-dependent epimerase/dehydratase family protein [Prolixibacteraceae bacterium]